MLGLTPTISQVIVSFNDYEIQQLGRWRSDTYKLYMDGSQARLLSGSLSASLIGPFHSLRLSSSHLHWLEHGQNPGQHGSDAFFCLATRTNGID